jgi:hypothetical protein
LEKGGEGEADFVRGLRCQKAQETLLCVTLNAVKIGETKHLALHNQMNFYKETAAALSMYQSVHINISHYVQTVSHKVPLLQLTRYGRSALPIRNNRATLSP